MISLWKVSQTENNGWDTFDSMVVAAECELDARNVHPGTGWQRDNRFGTWASSPDKVTVEFIGNSTRKFKNGEIIVSSFNAG